jgi:hypothetical protein
MAKKTAAQLNAEIAEVLRKPSEETISYYMSEACPHFALALHRLKGWPLAMLVDEANYEEWGGEEYPTIAHVFVLRPDGLAVDVKGPRTIAAIKDDFFDLEEPRVARIAEGDLSSMMGDNKPLYACSLEAIDKAKHLIKQNKKIYGV